MKNFTHRLAASHVSADQCVFVVVLCVELTDCLWPEADLVWFWSPGLWWTEAPVSRHQSSRWSLEHRVFLAEVVESCWGRRRDVLGPYWYFMSAVKQSVTQYEGTMYTELYEVVPHCRDTYSRSEHASILWVNCHSGRGFFHIIKRKIFVVLE